MTSQLRVMTIRCLAIPAFKWIRTVALLSALVIFGSALTPVVRADDSGVRPEHLRLQEIVIVIGKGLPLDYNAHYFVLRNGDWHLKVGRPIDDSMVQVRSVAKRDALVNDSSRAINLANDFDGFRIAKTSVAIAGMSRDDFLRELVAHDDMLPANGLDQFEKRRALQKRRDMIAAAFDEAKPVDTKEVVTVNAFGVLNGYDFDRKKYRIDLLDAGVSPMAKTQFNPSGRRAIALESYRTSRFGGFVVLMNGAQPLADVDLPLSEDEAEAFNKARDTSGIILLFEGHIISDAELCRSYANAAYTGPVGSLIHLSFLDVRKITYLQRDKDNVLKSVHSIMIAP